MAKTAVVHELINELPFHPVLTWEQFQALCTDVLYKRYNSVDSREYLVKGSTQQGIDAYSVTRGEEKLTVAQCKLIDYVGPKEVLDIVEEFLKGNLVEETKQFILCTSADLGRQRDEEQTIAKARAKLAPHGIEFILWDKRGLSKELRTDPSPEIINIVYRYFDEDIALAFYGERWSEYVKKFRKVDKHQYEKPLDYIERNIVSYTDSLKEPEPTIWDGWRQSDKFTLARLIEECNSKNNKKIVLLSTGGFGKTEELKNVAGYFSADAKLLYPVLFSLKNYIGQSIETVLSAYDTNWGNIEEEFLLLLFDGLDETPEKLTQNFIGQLNAFVEQHPKVCVIVSSRYNFYDVKHPQFSGFETFLLKPLTYYDIQKYLTEKLGADRQRFEALLEERNFSEYANSPYYLTRFVRFYKEEKAFPKNKSELFNRILFERWEKDEGRYNIPELKERLLPIARKIAFCMTIAGKSALSDEEMKSIVPDTETKRSLNHFGILNRNAAGVGSWAFEHKNLQEYLCASVFAESTFLKVHETVSSKLNSAKLLPRFLNTISFLFELLEPSSALFKELFSWLNVNEPELLVRFEKEQISRDVRLEIFKQIFSYYKEKKITLRASTNFSYEELAHFAEVDEKLIDFVTAEIKGGLVPNQVYDLISVLENGKRLFRYRKKLTDLLFHLLKDSSQPLFVSAKAITAFTTFEFIEATTFQQIIESGIDLRVYEIRQALILFLAKTTYFEEYSHFVLKSIPIYEDGQRQKNSIMSFTTLQHLILQFDSPSKIKEIFQYCIVDKNAIDRHHHHREFHFELSDVKALLEKATEAYKTEPSILPIVYRLYCGMEYLSIDNHWFQPFKSFFENTCGTRIIFQKFYRYDRKQRDIMLFADEWCCDLLIQEYKDGKIKDDEMIVFRNVLSHLNWQLFLYFYHQLKDLGEGRFIVDITTDYKKLYENQEEKNQLMLLNQQLFLDEAEEIFNIIAKDNVTLNDLWFSDNKELGKYRNSIVLEKIRNMCVHDEDKMITTEDFLEKYKKPETWEWVVVKATVALLKDNNKKTIVHDDLMNKVEAVVPKND